VPVADHIVCVDCGGIARRTPANPPEVGWHLGDLVAYRCRDCADVWYLEVTRGDLEDTAEDDASPLAAEQAAARRLVADLRAELDQIITAQNATPPDDEHDVEGASVGFERARTSALLASAAYRVAALDAAIERRASGSDDTCERCGNAIGDERQAALPTTRRCVLCAARRD
jgi:DnaK suppressor protein